MSTVAWVIVGGVVVLLVLNMRKTETVYREQQMTPDPTGGKQAEGPEASFERIANGIANIINAGVNVAKQVERN